MPFYIFNSLKCVMLLFEHEKTDYKRRKHKVTPKGVILYISVTVSELPETPPLSIVNS